MGTLSQVETVAQSNASYETSKTERKKGNYGRTIGSPELSDKAQEYYNELKKKFSNMDFILVSSDMKEMAKSQAGKYANPNKLVVLIDEEKIERMATDKKFRKQYEGIISGATTKLPQLQKSLSSTPGVKAFGMQVNDGGNASFFAVVDKSLAAQRVRIEKNRTTKAEQKKTDAKKEAKRAAKKAAEEKLADKRSDKAKGNDEEVMITASSIEELLRKINDMVYDEMSNSTQTEAEKMLGNHVDFRW